MKDWRGANEVSPWTIEADGVVFDNPWLSVHHHAVIHPGGRRGAYDVVRLKRLAVGVLPIDAQGRVALVGQWRFPLGRYSWEMPEGGADPGEDPAATARRELREETGLSAGALVKILEMDLSNSVTDERAMIFLATDLSEGVAAPDDTEVLAQARAPFQALLAAVVDGAVRDSLTVAATLRAHHMAVTGALPDALARAMLAQR